MERTALVGITGASGGIGIAAVQLAALGILGDVLAGSRVMQQRTLERVRRIELQLGVEPSHYEPGQEREVLKL